MNRKSLKVGIPKLGILTLLLIGALGLTAARAAQGETAGAATRGGAPVVSETIDPGALTVALPENSSSPTTSLAPACSACSDFACQGRSAGARCALPNKPPGNLQGTCQQLSDRVCTTDGLMTCRCAGAGN